MLPWRHLKAVNAASSTDTTRYSLCGVQVEVRSKNEVLLVATNGIAIIVSCVKSEHNAEKGDTFIIPSELIRRIEPTQVEEVVIKVSSGERMKRRITVAEPQAIHSSAPEIDGNYPNWRQVVKIPGDFKIGLTCGISTQITDIIFKAMRQMKVNQRLLPYENEKLGVHFCMITDDMACGFMPLRNSDSKKETFIIPEYMTNPL